MQTVHPDWLQTRSFLIHLALALANVGGGEPYDVQQQVVHDTCESTCWH